MFAFLELFGYEHKFEICFDLNIILDGILDGVLFICY